MKPPGITKIWNENPLVLILGLAIFFRLLSVVFARGWGMIDDHFLVIESAQSWVDGFDYNSWLPWSRDNHGPTGHNFFYPGLNFLLFSFFRFIHLEDPQVKMLLVRLINAAWSLITVYLGYRITEKISDQRSARLAGLLLAVFWFMPWMSVRNLIEIICIPFLMLSVWMLLKPEKKASLGAYFLSGLFLGLAFNIRMQTVFFSIGLGLAILLTKKWKGTILLTLGALLPVLMIQGAIGYWLWGDPFAELAEHIRYNLTAANDYFVLPWYTYLLFMAGILIPPVSLFIFFGFCHSWKKNLILFLPVAVFILFHSVFPNKQERFILPVIPLLIVAGIAGWNDFTGRSGFWRKRPKLLRGCWTFFWIMNLFLLPVVSVVYSKHARVESMTYLSKYPGIRQILVADANDSPELLPRFYLKQWPHVYDELLENESTDSMMLRVVKADHAEYPRFILFTGDTDLPGRVVKARERFPFLQYETTVEPGFIDNLMHFLNPVNKNKKVYIYRNAEFFPVKLK